MRRLYTDGASKGNGSSSQRAQIAVYDESRRQIVVDESVGNRTNNEAEFLAILRALDYAIAQGMVGDVCIVTDSQLTCNQILGRWKVKAEHLRPMVAACQRKLKEAGAHITWVPREQNHAGRYIEGLFQPDATPGAGEPAAAREESSVAAPVAQSSPQPVVRPRPAARPTSPGLRRTVPYWRRPDPD